MYVLSCPMPCRAATPILRQLTPDTPLDLNINLSDGETCAMGGNAHARDVMTLL